MPEFNEQELSAIKMVLEYANIEPNETNVRLYVAEEVISITHDANGSYCWYIDEAGNEVCLKVETLELIDTEEFE